MILVLDCETTGLPKNYLAPVTDLDNWPRAVQIAWATYENDGEIIENYNYIIRPDGFEIPLEATAKHGITTNQALTYGHSIASVLGELYFCLQGANWVVAHNIDFDTAVLGAEFLRRDMGNPFDTKDTICTMKASTDFIAIDNGRGSYKWPKLSELFYRIFPDDEMLKEHDAGNDVAMCARCFFELVELGVIRLDEPTILPVTTSEITKLATLRKSMAEVKAKRDDMLKKVTENAEYQNLGKQLADLAAAEAIVIETVRLEAWKQFNADHNKKPEGAGYQFKLFSKLTYLPGAALQYCMTDLKAALALDVKAFESVAKTGKLPESIVKVEDEYRVQIDADLSKFLKE